MFVLFLEALHDLGIELLCKSKLSIALATVEHLLDVLIVFVLEFKHSVTDFVKMDLLNDLIVKFISFF